MKRSLTMLGFMAMISISVAAQDTAKPDTLKKTAETWSQRTVRIVGKISDDGTSFIEEASHRVWRIENLAMLKGYEGQQAMLRGHVALNANMIQVLSVKSMVHYTNWADSAFRK
jgi:hypothetical protein